MSTPSTTGRWRPAPRSGKPFDTDYGSRDFTARDPEVNLWSFGTYRGEPR